MAISKEQAALIATIEELKRDNTLIVYCNGIGCATKLTELSSSLCFCCRCKGTQTDDLNDEIILLNSTIASLRAQINQLMKGPRAMVAKRPAMQIQLPTPTRQQSDDDDEDEEAADDEIIVVPPPVKRAKKPTCKLCDTILNKTCPTPKCINKICGQCEKKCLKCLK